MFNNLKIILLGFGEHTSAIKNQIECQNGLCYTELKQIIDDKTLNLDFALVHNSTYR
jgi:hypothetical protein